MRSKCIAVTELHQLWKLTIPTYQRTYSWTQEETSELVDDLLRAGQSYFSEGATAPISPRRYLGNIILAETPDSKMASVVDGQQRLITMSLCWKAMQELDSKLVAEIPEQKLMVHNEDTAVYKDIMAGDPTHPDHLMTVNYQFIKSKLFPLSDNEREAFMHGFQDAEICYIMLETGDDAQGVLSSLNSTGKPLSDFDLIKNASLMKYGEDQTDVYNHSWHQLMQRSKATGISCEESLRRVLSFMQVIPPMSKFKRLEMLKAFKAQHSQVNIEDGICEYYSLLEQLAAKDFGEEIETQLACLRGLPISCIESILMQLQMIALKDKDGMGLTPELLLKCLTALDTFCVRTLAGGFNEDEITSLINSAIEQLSKLTAESQAIPGCYDRAVEDFIFELFIRDETVSATVNEFERMLTTASKANLGILEYIFKCCEMKFSRKEISFEGASLIKCLPAAKVLQDEESLWPDYLKAKGISNGATFLSGCRNSIANYMLLEDNLEFANENPNEIFTGLQKSKFSMTRGFKKMLEITPATMDARTEKLVKTCDKLWAVPKVSMQCVARNTKSNWFKLNAVTSTRGLKPTGISVGELMYTGPEFKLMATTWKQTAWLIARSIFDSRVIKLDPVELAKLFADPAMYVDGKCILATKASVQKEAALLKDGKTGLKYFQIMDECYIHLENSADKNIKILTQLARVLNALDQIRIELN